MFRSDFSEAQFLENFARLTVAVEKLVPVPAAPVVERTKSFNDIRLLLRANRKIDAIKLFRELTNASLYEAKQQVDALQDRMQSGTERS